VITKGKRFEIIFFKHTFDWNGAYVLPAMELIAWSDSLTVRASFLKWTIRGQWYWNMSWLDSGRDK
jgi:hypothetical protein